MKIYNVSIQVISNGAMIDNEVFSFFSESEARNKYEALINSEVSYYEKGFDGQYVFNDGTPVSANSDYFKEKKYGDSFEIGEQWDFNENSTLINFIVTECPIYILNIISCSDYGGLTFNSKKFTNITELLTEAQNIINSFCDKVGIEQKDRYEHNWGYNNTENEYHEITINNYDTREFLFEDNICNRLLIKIQTL